ncbi:IclR family transcriptional regulator [Motilibacter rhizosphaerae]|uniref:Glycerol operon regulatory protein n=1 Tax=Motilibacter rhizosphaerae TaxID=598652 RepID=A0A4V2F516_9ACTN|nr:IclR family transcriptional regulator [Motilibacter rhizosphaerae]RZS91249.1 IclR family transcriptional regulator [Motilibacter rhizosphaerae]
MPGAVQSVERAAAILRLLAAGQGRLGVAEVASTLGLAKSTAHGLLRTLEQVGFVEQSTTTGKYQLGAALLHLGTSYLDVNELRSRAINWADPLASRSGEAVRIGTPLDGRVLVVHHVFRPDDSLQVLDVGALLPLHATALGKVLLAFSAGGTTLPDALEAYAARTITSRRALGRVLGEVREHGWALEVEEGTAGEAGVAAPIRGSGGLVVGAIGIRGAVERVCDGSGHPHARLVTLVRDAARNVSRDLGAPRW